MITIVQQSPMKRFRPYDRSFGKPYTETTALKQEVVAYQILLYSSVNCGERISYSTVSHLFSRIYRVNYVPVNWPHYFGDRNEDIELDEPGVMPDCLQPIEDEGVLHVGEALTVLWVEVKVDYSGDLKNIINFTDQYGKVIETCFDIHVIQKELPGKSFFYAQYIDPHSLSDTYGVPLFSSSFWDIFEKHVAMAVDHRVNTMLVPAYPIHYDDGIQYKSVQLVDIIYEGTQYTFNYDLLDSWLLILHRNGIKRIILPPIFPSFRDFKCPNFRCQKEYHDVPFFANDVTTKSDTYIQFMIKFMSKLIDHIDKLPFEFSMDIQITCNGREEDSMQYAIWKEQIIHKLKGKPVSEAMPEWGFCNRSDCAMPWIYLNEFATFAQDILGSQKVVFNHRSAYAQCNQQIATSAARLRGFGGFAFSFGISWFLNLFYNYSYDPAGKLCNLYTSTDNNGVGPSGTCYLVYPGPRAPYPSMRLKQLMLAAQDYDVFRCLDEFYSFLEARNLVKKELGITVDFTEVNPEKYLAARKKIIKLIEKKTLTKKVR